MGLEIFLFAKNPNSSNYFIAKDAQVQRGEVPFDSALAYLRKNNKTINEVYVEFDSKVLDLWMRVAQASNFEQPIVENYFSEGSQRIRTDAEKVVILCPEGAYVLKVVENKGEKSKGKS